MAPLWNCEICCEDFRDYTSTYIDGSPVCPACIREMFDKALRFEHEYPPSWSGPLHPSEFSHILPVDYIERYKHKEIEYKTQPGRRIYCQHIVERITTADKGKLETLQEPCGEFIGVRQRLSKTDMLILGRCKECKNTTCMVCDTYSSDPTATLQHVCTGKSSANEERAQAFVGLKRGRDWQQCPSRLCGRRIELSAACNHITCKCDTGFCFICGKEADGDSEHWSRKNGCPRYNHPEDLDAEYDDPYDDDEDDDLVDPTRDELGSEIDPLENVRNLFEVNEDDEDVVPALNTTSDEVMSRTDVSPTSDGLTIRPVHPDLAFIFDVTRAATNATAHVRSIIGVAAEAEAATEATETIIRTETPATPATPEMMPHTQELMAISAYDVEAMENAYFEDDLSDKEYDAYELLGNVDGPAMTMEDADIDRALWRMFLD